MNKKTNKQRKRRMVPNACFFIALQVAPSVKNVANAIIRLQGFYFKG